MATSFIIKSIAPGAAIHDRGRPGYQRYGISEGGVMDRLSAAEGAALLSQSPDLAMLELCGGGEFTVDGGPVSMSVTGADVRVLLNDKRIPMRSSFTVSEGQHLLIRAGRTGVYSYLHIRGGFDVPRVMGSGSTHVRAGFGGYLGRLLRAGDRIPVGSASVIESPLISTAKQCARESAIRVVWGAQYEKFTAEVRNKFLSTEFTVSPRRDRMGVRLNSDEGTQFSAIGGLSGISDAVVAGDVQIGGDGAATVLLADRQPTGGYPRIATVITADLDRFVQLPVAARCRFTLVTVEEAVKALASYRKKLQALPSMFEPLVRPPESIEDLLSYNLVSGVFDVKADE